MFVLITIIDWISAAIYLPDAISWAIPIVDSGKAPEYTTFAMLALGLFGFGIAASATGMFLYLVKKKKMIGNALMVSSICPLFAPRILMFPNPGAQLHNLILILSSVLMNAVVMWPVVLLAEKQKTIQSTTKE